MTMTLAFTELKVNDWPAMVRWYVETLGLELVLEDKPREFALLDAGPVRVALKGGGPPAPVRDAVRLVFEVVDVDVERDRLSACNVAVGPTEKSPEGYRTIRFRDPEGTQLTLFCWITTGKAGESAGRRGPPQDRSIPRHG